MTKFSYHDIENQKRTEEGAQLHCGVLSYFLIMKIVLLGLICAVVFSLFHLQGYSSGEKWHMCTQGHMF